MACGICRSVRLPAVLRSTEDFTYTQCSLPVALPMGWHCVGCQPFLGGACPRASADSGMCASQLTHKDANPKPALSKRSNVSHRATIDRSRSTTGPAQTVAEWVGLICATIAEPTVNPRRHRL